jgi:DNA mismatch endonuclease (patch repair protein)
MASIKSKGTKMEMAVKPLLEALGFEYHPAGVFGNPDFAHVDCMVAVFLDGCWWHGCPEHYACPGDNASFWADKVEANRKRDQAARQLLENTGWRVIRVWEHDLSGVVKAMK